MSAAYERALEALNQPNQREHIEPLVNAWTGAWLITDVGDLYLGSEGGACGGTITVRYTEDGVFVIDDDA